MRELKEKPCLSCGNIIKQKYTCSEKQWNNRVKYCSRQCNGKNLWKEGKGVTQFVKGHNPPLKGKKMSEEGKKNLITFMKGNVPWNKGKEGLMPIPWNKGKIGEYTLKELDKLISPIRESIRGSKKYIKWRDDIFKRDGYKCTKCFKGGKNLNAHHIKLFSQILNKNNVKNKYDSYKINELWDLTNGVTLCKPCHIETHKQINKLAVYGSNRT